MKITPLVILCLLLLLTACSAGSQIQSELYFGRAKPDAEMTDAEWEDFRNNALAIALPGFTEIDATGHWLGDGTVYNEKSKLVIYLHDRSKREEATLDSLIQVYKTRFQQESVLQVDQRVKGTFK